MTAPCGVLNINKSGGMTSRDVVNRLQRFLRKVKIGHAGTLDPLAEGVLVVCLGPATRLIQLVQQMPKTYEGEFLFGQVSDTDDIQGKVAKQENAKLPSLADVRVALKPMTGNVLQRPPAFSAIRVGGKRAYDLARQGEAVTLAPREVRIDEIEVLEYQPPRLALRVRCGSGVYIRSIGRDLGEQLGCGAVMSRLTRSAIGNFSQHNGVTLDELSSREDVIAALQPARTASAQLPELVLTESELKRIAHGQTIQHSVIAHQQYALLDEQSRLQAIGSGVSENQLRATINLPS